MRTKRLLVALAVVVLPGLVMLPVWQLAGLGAGEDDVLYYYPARAFFHETIQSGQWPWINPWTGLGRPVAADPQAALWYPFTWLFAVLPPLAAYPLSLWVHYGIALWGMYRLLRSHRLGRPAALFGAVAFAFCGFMLAHRAHFTMQHAAAWAPWVIWRLELYALSDDRTAVGRGRRSTVRLVLAAAVLAMQCLAGHVQIVALTACGTLVLLLAHGRGPRRPRVNRRGAGIIALRWLIACVCAAGLFAVQWLPTADYLRLCTRTESDYGDFVENSWHPASAVGLLLPMLLGQRTPNLFDQPYWGPSHQVEQFAYAGVVPLLLALVALRRWRSDPRRRGWVILLVFGLLLALGRYGPLCPLIYRIPGSSLFRCPARALLLVNLAVAALAAITLDDLGPVLSPHRARLRATLLRWTKHPIVLPVILVVGPLVLVLASLPMLGPSARVAALRALRLQNPAIWIPLLTALVALCVLRVVVLKWKRPGLAWLLLLVTVADLGVIGWTIDVPARRVSPVELLTPRQPADWMQTVRASPYRLWVVNGRVGRLPGEYVEPIDKAVANTNILRKIPALTDYGPLQPRALVDRFGFRPWGESGDVRTLLADTSWTRLYNVGWILLCDTSLPPPSGCQLVATTPTGWRLYRSPHARGLAFLEDPAQPGAVHHTRNGPALQTTRVDTWSPSAESRASNRDARPRVVLSQLALPGWTARLAGEPVPIEVVAGGLMGVRVPVGQAVEIDWSYYPPGLKAGTLVSLLTVAVLLIGSVGSLLRRQVLDAPVARVRITELRP